MPWFHICALATAAAAAMFDARRLRIPNGLLLPGLLLAPLTWAIVDGLGALGMSVAGALLAGVLPYCLFRARAAGGGDVKLAAALGACGGISFGIETLLFACTMASFVGVIRLAFHGTLLRTLASSIGLAVKTIVPSRFYYKKITEPSVAVAMGPYFLAATLLSIWIRTP